MTHAGDLLREWRQRRRLSQLDLAIAANVSARHLSFVETGRSRPTTEMILHLAEHLEVPLRDRNALLLAGGYAPAYPERGLAEPELQAVQAALKQVLAGQEPYPAVVVNRWWELVDANSGIAIFTNHVAPELLQPPVNVLRLSLHPDGMAPRIVNLPEWRAHVLTRLHRQAQATGDHRLTDLHDELRAYPGGESDRAAATQPTSWSRSATAATKATKMTKASSPSSASPRSSAPRWTSPSRSWPSSRSTPPTREPHAALATRRASVRNFR